MLVFMSIPSLIHGEIVEYTLQPGERLKVDTGHVAMFEPTVNFDVEMVKGVKNILFGGEGLFFATLTGPGRASGIMAPGRIVASICLRLVLSVFPLQQR